MRSIETIRHRTYELDHLVVVCLSESPKKPLDSVGSCASQVISRAPGCQKGAYLFDSPIRKASENSATRIFPSVSVG